MIFKKLDTSKNSVGRRESPAARSAPAQKLYKMDAGMPKKMMRI